MVLADFLTETRRKWLKAFKLFRTTKCRKPGRNRVSPELIRSPSYSGTTDARPEIDLQRFCRVSMPPVHIQEDFSSGNSTYNSYDSSRHESLDFTSDTRTDSAYNSGRSSPHPRTYAVTYFNVNDSEDSSSIRTEYTLLDTDDDDPFDDLNEVEGAECIQNKINESIEINESLEKHNTL